MSVDAARQIRLTIDGRAVHVPTGATLLDAAGAAGVRLPTLCHHPDLAVRAACRVCVVEVVGQRTLQAACACPATDGMVVLTDTPTVRAIRRANLRLLLSSHPARCAGCIRSLDCDLQRLCHEYAVEDAGLRSQLRSDPVQEPPDELARWLVRDPSRCILCRRCVAVCGELLGVGALALAGWGPNANVAVAGTGGLDGPCVLCGLCVDYCPTAAIAERDERREVWRALEDPEAVVMALAGPLVHPSLARLGFSKVLGVGVAEDLAAVEGAYELIECAGRGGPSLLTAWCPAWVSFAQSAYPGLLANLSACKSPMRMLGALARTYYAPRDGLDASRVVVVGLVPCVAHKVDPAERRPADGGYPDLDYALTPGELMLMGRLAGAGAPAREPGAGGAAPHRDALPVGSLLPRLLAAARDVSGEPSGRWPDFRPVAGAAGVWEAVVEVGDAPVRAAVVAGLAAARRVCDRLIAGESTYQVVEVLACPEGCARPAGRFAPDRGPLGDIGSPSPLRNLEVARLYAEFLGEPLGPRSREVLHTRRARRMF